MAENAEAGKKHIQKLLYSQKWDSWMVANYLWRLGDQRLATGEQASETLLARNDHHFGAAVRAQALVVVEVPYQV